MSATIGTNLRHDASRYRSAAEITAGSGRSHFRPEPVEGPECLLLAGALQPFHVQPWVTAQGDRCKLYILDSWESASEQSEFDHVRGC